MPPVESNRRATLTQGRRALSPAAYSHALPASRSAGFRASRLSIWQSEIERGAARGLPYGNQNVGGC